MTLGLCCCVFNSLCRIASFGYKCGIQFAWPVFVLRVLRMCVIQCHQYPLMWFGPSGLLAWHSDMGDCIMRYYCNVIQFPWAYTLFKDHCQQTVSWCAYCVMGCIWGEGRRGTCMLQWWVGSLCKLFQSLSVTDPLLYCVGPVLQAQTPQERSLCSLFNGLHMYAALSCDFFVLDREWLHLVNGYCCVGRKWRRRKWKSWGYSEIRWYADTY